MALHACRRYARLTRLLKTRSTPAPAAMFPPSPACDHNRAAPPANSSAPPGRWTSIRRSRPRWSRRSARRGRAGDVPFAKQTAMRASCSRFNAFGKIAQCPAVGAMRDLVADHHDGRERPLDDFEDGHQHEAAVPGEARMRLRGSRSRCTPQRHRRRHRVSRCAAASGTVRGDALPTHGGFHPHHRPVATNHSAHRRRRQRSAMVQ